MVSAPGRRPKCPMPFYAHDPAGLSVWLTLSILNCDIRLRSSV
jgi:hypothetical protein